MTSAEAHPPPSDFAVGLLALLKSAASDEADRERKENSNGAPDDTSTFTSDMMTSLPDQEGNVEMDKIMDRSRYVSELAAEKKKSKIEHQDKDEEFPFFGEQQTQEHQLTAQDRLNLCIEEFGESGLDHLLGGPEEHLADVTAYYVDQVVVKGCALLSTHRFCFLAFLPKINSPSKESGKEDVIRAGPGYFHRPARRNGRRRVWFELKKDILVGYPSSDRLYEPYGSLRMIDMENLAELIHGGKEVHYTMHGDQCWMEFDTSEAAFAWHRDLEGQMWQARHNTDTLRVAIPLPRIYKFSITPFMDFAKLMVFKVDQSDNEHDHLTRMGSVNIGVHNPVADAFLDPLRQQVKRFQEWNEAHSSNLSKVPLAILDYQDPTGDANADGEMLHHDLHHHHSDESLSKEKQFMIMLYALADDPKDMHLYRADVVRGIPNGGLLILTPSFLCFHSRRLFRSASSGVRTKIPLSDIQDVQPNHAFRWHHYGIKLMLHAHADLHFELKSREERDELQKLIKAAIASVRSPKDHDDESDLEEAESKPSTAHQKLAKMLEQDIIIPQHVLHRVRTLINVDLQKHVKLPPMRIACLTIGSRGDVQPYVALCKSLMEHGHQCVIVSHPEYKDWVNKHGVDFRPAGGDPGILMKLSVENKMFSPTFFTETLGKFRHWLDELLREIIEQCYDVDLIIESPSTFGGVHAAEALEIGYMRAFTMPWTKTSAYPQAFSVPSVDLGAGYNSLSYDLYEQVIWMASEGQINRWRRNMLGLASTTLAKLQLDRVPFMYNFSPAVVPPPLDWANSTTVSGYWNLASTSDAWQPPADLEAFIARARKQESKIAYIGFGSITIPNAHKTMQTIFDAAEQSGVFCVVSKGWSDRMEEPGSAAQKPWTIPDTVYLVDSIPHDWLFPRIDIAFHHGGAGTTGASLANKLVTLIHPFFGDQFFWANRVEKLGAGKRVVTLSMHDVKSALSHAAHNRLMMEKAVRVGEAIKLDRGVESARAFIYRHYKASKRKARRTTHSHTIGGHSKQTLPTPRGSLVSAKMQEHPLAERQDSGLGLVPIQSPGVYVDSDEKDAEDPSDASSKQNCGGYSSKRAKQEDVDRRQALLERCRVEGKLHILKVLDPQEQSNV